MTPTMTPGIDEEWGDWIPHLPGERSHERTMPSHEATWREWAIVWLPAFGLLQALVVWLNGH